MGMQKIFLCHLEDHYDIVTEAQATVFLVGAGLYTLIEGFFIWQTYKLIKQVPNFLGNKTLLVFCVLIHLIFITCALYCLGGSVICYNKILYRLIADYTDVLDRGLIYFLLFRIDVFLDTLKDPTGKISLIQKIFIAICTLDLIAYLPIVLVCSLDVAFCYRSIAYNMTNLLVLHVTVKTIKLIDRFPGNFKKKEWYALLFGVFMYVILRLGSTIYQLHSEIDKSNRATVSYAVIILIFNVSDNLLPCLIVVCFITRMLDQTVIARTWSSESREDTYN